MRSYLDHNATSPMRPEAETAMLNALRLPANPSSVHNEGRAARKIMETARQTIADTLQANAKAITFTSGGTEANNTVLTQNIQIGSQTVQFSHCFVSEIEHPCVLSGGRFPANRLIKIPVTELGTINLAALESLLEQTATTDSSSERFHPLISVMVANNETGVLQPIEKIKALLEPYGGLLHSDAIQAYGKIPLTLEALGADVITLAAHKIGGGAGAGAIVRANAGIAFRPLQKGGGQELGARGGTQNVPAIAAFAAAAEVACASLPMHNWQSEIESALKALSPDIIILGEGAYRLPNTTCFMLPNKKAETALIAYDMAGIALSSGSACSSGKVGTSHVMAAMGYDQPALRLSTGWNTTKADIEKFVATTARMI